MSSALASTRSGREAAIARRIALSAGKSALPPATERSRSGQRDAALPVAAAAIAIAAPVKSAEVSGPAVDANAGRSLSMLRRRLLSAGKSALQAATHAAPASPPPVPEPSASVPAAGNCGSCREQARMRRAELSQRGRGELPPARPGRPAREGRLDYPPKVVESPTFGGQRVTGLRIGRGAQLTGVDAGATLPVSGTQYIGSDGGAPSRGVVNKVGLSRTPGGAVVSGSMVRSQVPVTGDEAGSTRLISGEADPLPADDLTPRSAHSLGVSAQFQRQTQPHGQSVFGSNLGRSAGSVGSRRRDREPTIESTDGGQPISGSALGRSSRVTGDEDGACRHITGDQYLSPTRMRAECGGPAARGMGSAPMHARRDDPVSGAKVSQARTWSGQRVTGANVEHLPSVTGDEAGSCALVTGTPYQGASTMQGWCDPADVEAAASHLSRREGQSVVSGDVPMIDARVSGTPQGTPRAITGTPYHRATQNPPTVADPVALVDQRFSIRSPQRAAHLRVDRQVAGRISGSFAIGDGKITGNREFLFSPRHGESDEKPAARTRLSGEGRTEGTAITGSKAWAEQHNVTGTEDFTAAKRNPSQRGAKAEPFAGAQRFKARAKADEPHRQHVTGMVGWSSKSAAKVTLTGGAQA